MHAFDVLGDPVRRRILELLARGELTAGAIGATISDEWGISQPAVSQHLRVLRESGFVMMRPDGTRRIYAVRGDGLRDIDAWLDRLRRAWTPPLDAARDRDCPRQAPEREEPMIDVATQINAVRRRVGAWTLDVGAAATVTIGQTYDTDIDDLWDACTNAERIPRWFLPISGDLRVGGRYELTRNASGTIESCDPPRSFTATWEYGEKLSWIEVRLTPESENRTRFELEHIMFVDDQWDEFGPGAVGIGWDLALTGLVLHLASRAAVDAAAVEQWTASDEGRRFTALSGQGWCDADIAGGADPLTARAAAARTIAAYTGSEHDTPAS